MKRFICQVYATLRREWILDMSNSSSLYGILLYSFLTVLISALAFREPLSPEVWSILLGIILLFVAMTTVAKSFSDESPERMRLVFQYSSPEAFISGKMIYNAIFMVVSALFTMTMYFFFLRDPGVKTEFVVVGVVLGGMGLGVSLTLLSAIAAAVSRISVLLAILGFPLIIPLLNAVIRLLFGAYQEVWKWGDAYLILGITAMSYALSVVLYPYLWQE
jgi:heme exporter protein B